MSQPAKNDMSPHFVTFYSLARVLAANLERLEKIALYNPIINSRFCFVVFLHTEIHLPADLRFRKFFVNFSWLL
jgi:hypothetical protein